MKTIKFRAWNKKKKEMWSPEANAILITLDGRILDSETLDDVTNDFDLMRYVDMKDRNGTEIFEGDCVKGWGWDSEFHYGVIEELNEFGCWPESWVGNMPGSGDWEVTGNIYQFPKSSEVKNEESVSRKTTIEVCGLDK